MNNILEAKVTDLEIIKEIEDVISDIEETTDHVIVDQLQAVVLELESRCAPITSSNRGYTKCRKCNSTRIIPYKNKYQFECLDCGDIHFA